MDIESASQTMRPSSVVVAVVLAAILVLPSFEYATATDCDESGSCYTNPVIATNHPDPGSESHNDLSAMYPCICTYNLPQSLQSSNFPTGQVLSWWQLRTTQKSVKTSSLFSSQKIWSIGNM